MSHHRVTQEKKITSLKTILKNSKKKTREQPHGMPKSTFVNKTCASEAVITAKEQDPSIDDFGTHAGSKGADRAHVTEKTARSPCAPEPISRRANRNYDQALPSSHALHIVKSFNPIVINLGRGLCSALPVRRPSLLILKLPKLYQRQGRRMLDGTRRAKPVSRHRRELSKKNTSSCRRPRKCTEWKNQSG